MRFTAYHHTSKGPKPVAESDDKHECYKKAKEYLVGLEHNASELDMVVTVWRSCGVVGVVSDDANGLATYDLRHNRHSPACGERPATTRTCPVCRQEVNFYESKADNCTKFCYHDDAEGRQCPGGATRTSQAKA